MGAQTRILFSLRKSRGNLKANRLQERTQIVGYALVQAIEFAALFFSLDAIPAEGRQQSRSEGSVDSFE